MNLSMYSSAPCLSLPLFHSTNENVPEVDTLDIICPDCMASAQDIRCSTTEFRDSMVVDAAGMCHHCRNLVSLHFRVHPWGTQTRINGVWYEQQTPLGFWSRLVSFIKGSSKWRVMGK